MSNDWLKELKVGDKVIYTGRWEGQEDVVTVDRVTKTLIICGSIRVRKSDGSALAGSGWNRSYIRPCTEEDARMIEAARLAKNLSKRIAYSPLPLATLRAIAALIEEGKDE